jgi:hypothetical protein
MTRFEQIRSLYAELRRATGDRHSPRVLLACAESLAELFTGAVDAPEFSLHAGGVSFDRWGVDRVFADGGWRLLARDCDPDIDPYEDALDAIDVRRIIAGFEQEAYA